MRIQPRGQEKTGHINLISVYAKNLALTQLLIELRTGL